MSGNDGDNGGGGNTVSHGAEQIPGRNGGKLTPIRSPERSREMTAMREAKKQQAIRAGVAKASLQVPGVERANPYSLIEAAAENHALNSLDPSARGSQHSLSLILKQGWPEPAKDAGGVPVPAGGAVLGLSLSPELAREILAAMDRRRDIEA